MGPRTACACSCAAESNKHGCVACRESNAGVKTRTERKGAPTFHTLVEVRAFAYSNALFRQTAATHAWSTMNHPHFDVPASITTMHSCWEQ